MKKKYLKPGVQIVQFQNQHHLMAVSGLGSTRTNLDIDDDLDIDDTPAGTDFWGR